MKIAFLTAGGLAPCLSSSIGALIEQYAKLKPEAELIGYLNGYRGLLLGKSIKFPEELILKLPKGERYALAGSISLENIENIKKLGVNFCDLSSNLESDTQIGYKDHQKIKKFVKKINEQ